jgi:hypothetical protein
MEDEVGGRRDEEVGGRCCCNASTSEEMTRGTLSGWLMYRSYSSVSEAETFGLRDPETNWPRLHWFICALLGVEGVSGDPAIGCRDELCFMMPV